MSSKLKILSAPIHESGVSYYRHHLPLLALREKGHTVIAHDDALYTWCAQDDYEGWLKHHLDKGVDVIHGGWSNSVHHIELLVAARERYKIPVLIDYDDDVLSVDKYNVNYKHYHEGGFSRRVARLGMRVADWVTVSTVPLKAALDFECRRTEEPRDRTIHLPNYTHPPHWQHLPVDPRRSDDKSVRVMFAGGPSHLGDLTQVKEAVEWAIRYYDGNEGRSYVKLLFVTCMPDWAASYITNPRSSTANRVYYMETGGRVATWHKVIKWVAPDILMAPLLHNPFNTAKSDIKVYDAAMVEGCAFMCEDYDTYRDVPTDACLKVQGEGWKVGLKTLIEGADLRRDLSAKLRGWVLDNRVISTYISKWEHAYEQALATPIVSSLSDVVRPRIYGPNGQLARDTD